MQQFGFSLKNFKPKAVHDLVRLGNNNRDGGYVLSERQVQASKVLIGIGINDDWTFEADFKNRNKGCAVYCLDFSVSRWGFLKGFIFSVLNVFSLNTYGHIILNRKWGNPLKHPIKELTSFAKVTVGGLIYVFSSTVRTLRIYLSFISFFKPSRNNYFIQKGVSDATTDIFITPDEMFALVKDFSNLPDNSVYLKMDIEGSEYDIMRDLLRQAGKINGMAIEFHNLKQFWDEFNRLMDEARAQQFEIVHIHGNNVAGYIENTHVPNLIEVSLMKRSLLTEDELAAVNNKTYPIAALDRANILKKPDLDLSFD